MFLSIAFATLFITGCKNIDNQLSRQEEQEGWMLLFDGKTLAPDRLRVNCRLSEFIDNKDDLFAFFAVML